MKMYKPRLQSAFLFFFAMLLVSPAIVSAQEHSAAVVFFDSGFPLADSASASRAQLETILPGARFASLDQLAAQLNDSSTRLLVLPYGSAFPEQAWAAIYDFLKRGGNLLVLGGQPFSRAAYRDSTGWHLRDYSVRFMRPLMVDQYQITPGSDGLNFQTNPDVTLQPKPFAWKRAFSPVIRLSAVDLYNRGGSAGSIDARLDALAWGAKDGRRLAAPLIQIDHLRNGFDGGRWIFLNAELAPDFYASADAANLIRNLAERAMQGSEEFTVRPALPLYLPGEPVVLELLWHPAVSSTAPLSARISTYLEGQPASRSVTTVNVPPTEPIVLPAPATKGFHIIETELLEGNKIRAIYHSAFWIRDEEFLRSGPRLTVNPNYFELDGKPLAVAGTTYMASDAQRLYFAHPNPYVWNEDLALIHSASLNMIRTGWWTGWEKFCDENGQPYDRTLRTIEAYLMTARKNGLPVQFNFFAFLPEVLGGANPYLDPEVVRRQHTLVSAVAARFHDVPYLAYDLINEPSISKHLWTMRPNDDSFELAKWNQWLLAALSNRAVARRRLEFVAGNHGRRHPASAGYRIHAARYVRRTQFAEVPRFFPVRAGRVFGLGAGHARKNSRRRIAATHHRGAGRRRLRRSPLPRVLRTIRGLHHQPFLVAKRRHLVGFAGRQAAGKAHADSRNRLAAGTHS